MSETATHTLRGNSSGGRTYSETVALGFYDRPVGGLMGKYDNVRTYWEDQITRFAVRPLLAERLLAAGRRGVRVLDLGCGSGQGFELLTRITQSDLSLEDAPRYVLPADRVSRYLGLDLSPAMVEQGRRNYEGRDNIAFRQLDLREGLGPVLAEAPFDVYFSAYGSLSHLETAVLKRCLTEVINHADPGALVVLDLVGRCSLEWPAYWSADKEVDKVRPYTMSYLYQDAERADGNVESFPLRFWTGQEVQEFCRELSRDTGQPTRPVEILDRSLFVGRHVDTREYGCPLPPLRGRVNRLFEHNVRTRLEDLLVRVEPSGSDPDLDRFFVVLADCWNQVVRFTIERLAGTRVELIGLKGWREFPPALQLALMTMDRIVDSVAWIDVGDVRANIIEPQLAYVLRRLEHGLQRGIGCGHGLVAVLQVGTPETEA